MTTPATMNPETLQALKDSIAHWERMRDGGRLTYGETPMGSECALCDRFVRNAGYDSGCFGASCTRSDGEQCPVLAKTGEPYCRNSPWATAKVAFFNLSDHAWRLAAQDEIDFLKSLLPEGEST